MINLSGELSTLYGDYTVSNVTMNTPLYAWSASQIDTVCQALKNLLVNNVSSLSVVSSATNNYILSHTNMESGYALRIFGYASGSNSTESYVELSEGTYTNGVFTPALYYRLYPLNKGVYNGGTGYGFACRWYWNYYYVLQVDDDGKSFLLSLNVFSTTASPIAYREPYPYTYCGAGKGNNAYGSMTYMYNAGGITFGLLPINSKYYFTVLENIDASANAPGSCMIYQYYSYNNSGRLFARKNDLCRGGSCSPANVFKGKIIYNRKYVIASTMTPVRVESDYGNITMVRLGGHEYGLPYIDDNAYLENVYACSLNSSLVDGQIIEIDGAKYLYSSSGYLFKLGAVPTPLAAPTISLSGDTLTITPVTNATSYKVRSDGTLATTVSTTTVDLSSLSLAAGTHSITVIASATGYLDSDPSAAVSYTASGPSGQTVTFSVYNGEKDWYGEAYFKFDAAPENASDYDFYVYGGYDGASPDVYGGIVPGGYEHAVGDGATYSGSAASALYCWGNSNAYVDVDGVSASLGTWQSPTVIPVSANMNISVTADSFDD